MMFNNCKGNDELKYEGWDIASRVDFNAIVGEKVNACAGKHTITQKYILALISNCRRDFFVKDCVDVGEDECCAN